MITHWSNDELKALIDNCAQREVNGYAFVSEAGFVASLAKALLEAREVLRQVKNELLIPAAEYVPSAIWENIDAALPPGDTNEH